MNRYINKLKLSKLIGLKQNKFMIIRVTDEYIIYCINGNTKFNKVSIKDYDSLHK